MEKTLGRIVILNVSIPWQCQVITSNVESMSMTLFSYLVGCVVLVWLQ